MRKPTRAERFLVIRNEVLRHLPRMTSEPNGARKLTCGPFTIHYRHPGLCGPTRGYNLTISPGARIRFAGLKEHGQVVCNVDWNQFDRVDILSYRSGSWEQELLDLLRPTDNTLFFG